MCSDHGANASILNMVSAKYVIEAMHHRNSASERDSIPKNQVVRTSTYFYTSASSQVVFGNSIFVTITLILPKPQLPVSTIELL